MSYRWIVNSILSVMVVILVILVIYTPHIEKTEEKAKITQLEPSQVTKLKIDRKDSETLEFVKNTDRWEMISPLVIPANSFRMETLLNTLTEENYKKLGTEQLKLSEVGLESPKINIIFNDQLTIGLGDSSPLDQARRYVSLGQNVYLVTDIFSNLFKEKATDFMSLSLLEKDQKMTEIETSHYHLRYQENRWIIISSDSQEVDNSADALNNFIEQWQNKQALSVEYYEEQAEEETNEAETEEVGDIQEEKIANAADTDTDTESTQQKPIVIHLKNQAEPLQFLVVSTEPDFILARPDKGIEYRLINSTGNSLLQLPKKKTDLKK